MKRLLLLTGLLMMFMTVLTAQISAPYTQNFDTMTANQLPSQGWSGLYSGTGSAIAITSGANARSAPNFARVTATTGTSILISPEISNLEECKLKFWVRIAQAAPFPNLIVGVMSDNTDPDSFVPVETITGLNQTYRQVEINMAAHASNGPFIAFKHGNLSTSKNIAIDDFALEVLATTPVFAINPSSKDFGMIGAGGSYQSAPQIFTISNAGIGTLGINSISLSGTDASDFVITSQPESYPLGLGAGESTTLVVVFSPATEGHKTANLVVVDDQAKAVNTITLSGEGFIRPDGSTCIDPLLTALPIVDYAGDLSSSFGNDYASGWISPSSTYLNGHDLVYKFTLEEESYLSGSIAGTNSRTGLFILAQCPDPTTPAPVLAKGEGLNGGSFTNVAFTAGDYFAIVSSSQTTSSIAFVLNLTAVAAGSPSLAVNPSSMDYATTVLGTSKSQVFTLTNIGGSGLSIVSASLTGSDAAEFSITSQPALYPADLAFTEQLQMTIAFTPSSEGVKSASLEIAHNSGIPVTIPLEGFGFKQFEGGNGSSANPFQVNTIGQLDQVRQYLGVANANLHFIQTADLDLSANEWQAIGSLASPFYGSYNGNGYKILNLSINRPVVNNAANMYQGLFAATTNANLRNVSIVNANITGYTFLGALVGTANSSTIENCSSSGTLNGFGNIGGLVGQSTNSALHRSFSTANVNGVNALGGLIGIQNSTVNPAIQNCYATGNVTQTAMGNSIGGLAGQIWAGGVLNCYSTGTITGFGTTPNNWGGLIGASFVGNIATFSYYNSETSGMTDSNKGLPRTTDAMTYPYAIDAYQGWDFVNTWVADPAGLRNNGYPYLLWQYPPIVIDGSSNPPAGVTITADPSPVVPSGYPGTASPAANSYTITATGQFEVIVARPAAYTQGWILVLRIGAELYGPYDLSTSHPNAGDQYSFGILDFDAKGSAYYFEDEVDNFTLPVTLSSFTAVLNSELFVTLAWVAQSETNHAGYNLFRNQEGILQNAVRVNLNLINNGVQNGSQITYNFTDQEVNDNTTYYYWLESVDLNGTSQYHGPVVVSISGTEQEPEAPALPLTTELKNTYPNPFNPSTTIAYSINVAEDVQIDIFNSRGQKIRSLAQSHFLPGNYSLAWDGRDSTGRTVSSGLYFYTMTSGEYRATKKMLMAK